MEDSMFDEQFVTTAEEIREAREALIELGKASPGTGMRLSCGRRRSPTRRYSPKWVRAGSLLIGRTVGWKWPRVCFAVFFRQR
jgi:hypothetical protein